MSSRQPNGQPSSQSSVVLSTSSVYPEGVEAAFEIAANLGYDGIEVMVSIEPASHDIDEVLRLQDVHGVQVRAIHAPCLLITQRVWGTDPWGKLEMSAEMAHEVGAGVVVVHPPFRWQREYAKGFVEGIALLEKRTDIVFAVENMFPWRASAKREMQMYLPHWDPTNQSYAHLTLDVSHAATSRQNSLELAKQMGDRLHHLHLTDGSGSAKDEHLVPGRGTQPVAELLEHLAENQFAGHLTVEVSTRKAPDRAARELELSEALAFARLHFTA
ncbi:MAG: sugar phosphate isomerase/epimerase [Nocardioidaceae bacterium]|nr:MAG: sugar phosphate isomerase/epimerase [Nocardioidaceae bacterium]